MPSALSMYYIHKWGATWINNMESFPLRVSWWQKETFWNWGIGPWSFRSVTTINLHLLLFVKLLNAFLAWRKSIKSSHRAGNAKHAVVYSVHTRAHTKERVTLSLNFRLDTEGRMFDGRLSFAVIVCKVFGRSTGCLLKCDCGTTCYAMTFQACVDFGF